MSDDSSDQDQREVPSSSSDDEQRISGGGIIVPTSFDAYFQHNSSRAQTSANVFSSIVPPLSMEEYAEATASLPPPMESAIMSEPRKSLAFQRMMLELRAGFNVLCYGYGSKRRLLNDFAVEHCSKVGHVVIANGFQPTFSFKEFLSSIEANVPQLTSLPLSSSTIEGQTRRIHEFFRSSTLPHLYMIIHNIDSSALRVPKVKSCLSLLALNPRVHLVASIDHINAPLLWSSSEVFARKDPSTKDNRGFAWIWHDLTTLQPYDFELAHVDRSSLSGAHGGGKKSGRGAGEATVATGGQMSETAALHILASVTQKAKKLFVMMAQKQLEAAGEDVTDVQSCAIAYDMLFNAARDDFIATSDTALRALLGEFKDHGLVVGAEALWIPMRKERLRSVITKIDGTD